MLKRYDSQQQENNNGDWVKYNDVVDMLYKINYFQRTVSEENIRYPFGGLVHFFNLPEEYRYLFNIRYEDMSEKEREIYYKAIPVAKLDPI